MAFVPSPLPPSLTFDNKTVNLLSAADNALGRLGGMSLQLVNPYLVSNPLLRREAILSSRIEGTNTTPANLALFEVGEESSDRDEAREVQNYILAMNHGLKMLAKIPVCLRLCREVHRVLMAGARGENQTPGEFRRDQNWIGPHGEPITAARFVPPPVPQMTACLTDFDRYINSQTDIPILVRLALIHYQFEAIHPFRDGNGRVGRLLIPLILCSEGQLATPMLYLSSYLEKNKDAYTDLLLAVSARGAWVEWIHFFLRGVTECSVGAIDQLQALMTLRESYRQQFSGARQSVLLTRLIDELFQRPAVTIKGVATKFSVSFGSANKSIKKLVEAGILAEATGRQRRQVFLARGVLLAIMLSPLPAAGPAPSRVH